VIVAIERDFGVLKPNLSPKMWRALMHARHILNIWRQNLIANFTDFGVLRVMVRLPEFQNVRTSAGMYVKFGMLRRSKYSKVDAVI
jgi:hypothetical protein